VIYDAEDRPEPDQLLKAVAAFQKVSPQVVCLQAKLNYYNPRQNLLTRWFMIEYATWFGLFLPGLHAFRAPIPLGGTSNHFRTDVLRQIGGWDPFNVTEDCDLGIRIHKLGDRTQVLDTTTWEEANSKVGNWVRQRSRWVKGYLQTHFTHMRHPLGTLWRLRPWGMFHFLNAVGGLSLMLLLNPIFWAALALYAGLFLADLHEHDYNVERALGVRQSFRDAQDRVVQDRTVRIPHPSRHAWPIVCTVRPRGYDEAREEHGWPGAVWSGVKEDWNNAWLALRPAVSDETKTDESEAAGPEPPPPTPPEVYPWNLASHVFFLCTLALVLGNFFFVLVHVVACIRTRMPSMIPYALLMPFYWILISFAAWKGLLQLLWKPFYWEKTRHGLDAPAGTGS
jgi:hypothetical protein